MIVFAVPEGEVAALEAKDGADGRPGGEIDSGPTSIGGWQRGVLARVLPAGLGRELPVIGRLREKRAEDRPRHLRELGKLFEMIVGFNAPLGETVKT